MKKNLSLVIVGFLCLSTLSVLAPQIKANSKTIIFEDDFETYAVGSFPSAGGWELVWNGKGTAYQVVTDTVSYSPTKSLRLWGQSGWSANVQRKFTSSAEIIGFEAYVRTESNSGSGWKVASICFWKLDSPVPWGKRFADVGFGPDGQLYTRPVKDSSSYFPLGLSYEADRWYKVGVIIDRTVETYDVWIDDVLAAEDVVIWDTYEIDALMMESGHSSIEVHFDDVTVFEGAPAPRLLAMFSYAEEMIDRSWSFPNGTTFTFRGWLQSKGFSVSTVSEAFPTGEITLSGLQDFQAILAFSDFFGDPANVGYIGTILDYVSLGGGLILLGQGSRPSITIDEAFGFCWSGSEPGPIDPWSFYVDAGITDYSHPIMQGITELPKAGGVFVDWDTLIDETPLPSGTAVLARTLGTGGPYDPIDRIAMIAFQYGDGNVVAGPWDGLARPYGPTAVNPWDVIAEPIIENKLLINAINWVAGAYAPDFEISVSPKPTVVVHVGGWNDSTSLLLKSVNGFEGSIALSFESPSGLASVEFTTNPVYLDEDGQIDVEMNVSCLWAPLSTYVGLIKASSDSIKHEVDFEIVVAGNSEAIQNIVNIEEINVELNLFELRFRWFSIQQNFHIYAPNGTCIYWAQNIVAGAIRGIRVKHIWVRSIFQVFPRNPQTDEFVLNIERGDRLVSEPFVLNLTSHIEGNLLVLENNASPPSGAFASLVVPEGSYIVAFPRWSAPQICLVGHAPLTIFNYPITSTIAVFEYPTSGQVECYSKLVGEDTWRSTVNRVFGISESQTAEQSRNLSWWPDGSFLWSDGLTDQGISFTPNYATIP